MDAQQLNWSELPREQVAPGFERQMLWGERVMVARLHLGAGTTVPLHQHENEQVSMCLSGQIRLWLGAGGEQAHTLNAGDTLIIPGHLPHRAEVLADFEGLDIFSPPRQDWIEGSDSYLRK